MSYKNDESLIGLIAMMRDMNGNNANMPYFMITCFLFVVLFFSMALLLIKAIFFDNKYPPPYYYQHQPYQYPQFNPPQQQPFIMERKRQSQYMLPYNYY